MVHNEEKRQVTVFVVNRSLEEEVTLTPQFEDFGDCVLKEHVELYAVDLEAVICCGLSID